MSTKFVKLMLVLILVSSLLIACSGGDGCYTITQERGELAYDGNNPTPKTVTVVYWLKVCGDTETSGSYVK